MFLNMTYNILKLPSGVDMKLTTEATDSNLILEYEDTSMGNLLPHLHSIHFSHFQSRNPKAHSTDNENL